MTYLFNCDFEEKLFNQNLLTLESNRVNQEFEYLYFFCGENEELFSSKDYELDYLNFIEFVTGNIAKITRNPTGVKPWWGDSSQLDKKLILQSKLETSSFAIENNLAHPQSQICSSIQDVKYELCKFPYSMSGKGHYIYPRQMEKIQKLLVKTSLVNEPLLKRSLDISSYFEDGRVQTTYINHVDESFHYKGTIVGEFVVSDQIRSEYFDKISRVMSYVQSLGYTGGGSVDSFVYSEGDHDFLYALSEINTRKTMGHLAHLIYQRIYDSRGVGKFGVVKRKKNIAHQEIFNYYQKKVIPLSPNDNLFHTYLVISKSMDEVFAIEKSLLTML